MVYTFQRGYGTVFFKKYNLYAFYMLKICKLFRRYCEKLFHEKDEMNTVHP